MTTTMQSTRSTRRWRGLAAASLLVVAPLSLAACGGSSSASTSTAKAGNSSGNGNQASAADMQAYRECLAKNGVSMPTPPANGESRPPSGESDGTPPSMPDQSTMQAAQKACADLAPAGGTNPGAAPGGGGQEMQAFAQCLTKNGVTLPDPSQSGAPPANPGSNEAGATQPSDRGPLGLDTSDPTVKAAVAACADVAPKIPSGGAPSNGASSNGAPSNGAPSNGASSPPSTSS